MRTQKFSNKVEYLLAGRGVRRVRGQSMVELALTLPLLLLILFGVIDLGRLSMSYVTIANASREGARYGMTKSTDPTGIAQAAVDEAAGLITAADVGIQCASSGTPTTFGACPAVPQPGDRIKVTVNYTFNFVTLFIIGLSNISISDYTTMVIVK